MPDQDVAALIAELREAAHDSLDAGLLRKGADALERCEADLRQARIDNGAQDAALRDLRKALDKAEAERARLEQELESAGRLLKGEWP